MLCQVRQSRFLIEHWYVIVISCTSIICYGSLNVTFPSHSTSLFSSVCLRGSPPVEDVLSSLNSTSTLNASYQARQRMTSRLLFPSLSLPSYPALNLPTTSRTRCKPASAVVQPSRSVSDVFRDKYIVCQVTFGQKGGPRRYGDRDRGNTGLELGCQDCMEGVSYWEMPGGVLAWCRVSQPTRRGLPFDEEGPESEREEAACDVNTQRMEVLA